MYYLDYNASAPLRPEARAAMEDAWAEGGNASSVHAAGRRARAIIENAREKVAALVSVKPEQVIFTGGGTEANNMALRGWPGPILASAVEHDSVLACAKNPLLPVNSHGVLDLEALEASLAALPKPGETLVAVMLVNNETGVIQPVAEAAAIARKFDARTHCDAVQAAGKLPLDFHAYGLSAMSLSAHKIGGPQGVGALIVAEGVALAPLLQGGGQERRRRAGTENVAGIAGFGAAASLAVQELDKQEKLRHWRDRVEAAVKAAAPDVVIAGEGAPRAGNVSCIIMPGVKGSTQLMAFDLAGVAVGSGSACSSGKLTPSHVLRAMGYGEGMADAAIRVSLGWNSQAEDAEAVARHWQMLYQRMRGASAVESEREHG